MHIGFVTTESPYSDRPGCGIAAYLRALIPAITGADHRVTVFAKADSEKIFTAENGKVTVHHFRLPSVHWFAGKIPGVRQLAPLPVRQLEWSWTFYRRVARVAALDKLDVIEATDSGSLLLGRLAPLVIRLHGSELSFREHSGMNLTASVKWNDRLEALACTRASAITAPSHFHANAVANRRGWVKGRVQVIPNPISGKLLNEAAGFRRNGSNERIVLYTGRLAPVKGIETLLAAAKQIRITDTSIKFVLAGPWQMPHDPEYYGLQANNNTSGTISWVGPQDHEQLIDWYKRASVVVMPSHYESFGISAVEAVAFGTPVIATRETAIQEVLSDDDFVSFVAKADAKGLAERIKQVVAGRNVHRPSSQSAVAAVEPYQPHRVAEQTLKVYRSILR